MKLRQFNSDGIAAFRIYLAKARTENKIEPPWSLLEDSQKTEPVTPEVEMERPGFRTKRDAANYLHKRLSTLPSRGLLQNAGLWTWLGLFYFNDLSIINGKRRVLSDYSYIYHADDALYHSRHLLAVSYRIMLISPSHGRLLLNMPVHTLGGATEYVMQKLYLTRIPCIFEVMDRLYYDHRKDKSKKGISDPQPRPGDLRARLPARIRQLEKTYDLQSLDADQMLRLLGDEFKSWLDGNGSRN